MNETVSLYIKVGVTLGLFASLLIFIVALTGVAVPVLNGQKRNFEYDVRQGIDSEKYDILDYKDITAPEAFRFIDEHDYTVLCKVVTYNSGVLVETEIDYNELIKKYVTYAVAFSQCTGCGHDYHVLISE